MTIIPFKHTSTQFSALLSSRIGKGKQQALAIYRSLFRTGSISSSLSEFANAPNLYQQMVGILDTSTYPILTKVNDEKTVRFLIQTADGHKIETVLIPMNHGNTVCVSSQIGCKMGCSFCRTAKLGLIRNLTAAEIVQQVFITKFVLKAEIHNIVFMGMGEPLDNYDAVLQATNVLSDPNGLAIGARHITISTSGIVPAIVRIANEPSFNANLTVSLNAPNETLRSKLMPSRPESLKELYQSMKTYCTKRKKKVYVSYILIEGVNDSVSHADELCNFLKGLETRINLIPFNTHDKSRFSPSDTKQIFAFMQQIRSHNIPVLLRGEKGSSIQAACGQLAAGQLAAGQLAAGQLAAGQLAAEQLTAEQLTAKQLAACTPSDHQFPI